MLIRIATRKSKLALWQANHVAEQLKKQHSSLKIELVEVHTKGDEHKDRPLAEIGGKALFIKALEQALLDDEADIAVHSLKDVPAELEDAFTLAAILKRESPFDALVAPDYDSLEDLPQGAYVGTASPRRQAQLLLLRPDLEIECLRGNVDTRLRKLDQGDLDAIVLAEAGLNRLGLKKRATQILTAEQCLPSAGQGAIVIECVPDRQDLIKLVACLDDANTRHCVTAERAMIKALHGNCHSPIGAYAVIEKGRLVLQGRVTSIDGEESILVEQDGKPDEDAAIGKAVAKQLLKKGAERLL